MGLKVYLSGEIHTDWREQIQNGAEGLDVEFSSPVTDHASSDDCGVAILGPEENKFWYDRKGAQINAIRTRKAIQDADVVVVRFGEKYKQWNAAFDAGYAAALGKSLDVCIGRTSTCAKRRGGRSGFGRGGEARSSRPNFKVRAQGRIARLKWQRDG